MFANRLAKRSKHLKKWARRIGTDAYRLYDRDIPEVPLLLEVYGDAVAGWLYERPYEKDDGQERLWLEAMSAAAAEALGMPLDRLFLKRRKRQRGTAQYERVAEQGVVREVTESGLRFRVNLSDYLDTGLFLDHRGTRDMVRGISAGYRILNLFCYTASFSVHAAAGGALEIDSVDLSNTYLDWAEANFRLNGFQAVHASPQEYASRRLPGRYRLVRADALRFLEGAIQAGLRWDLIILDPPTFSNSKKMAGTLDIRRDYLSLINLCRGALEPGGTLIFSTNAKGFRLASQEIPNAETVDITERTLGEDFKGKSVRSCYMIRV